MSYRGLADASAQYAYNTELSRTESFGASRLVNKANKVVDVPVLMWDDKYLEKPQLYIDLCRRISDYMLFNRNPLYQWKNPNQAFMLDVVEGKLRLADYQLMDQFYGESGALPTVDNNFFVGAKAALQGQILSQAFKFATKNVNTNFAEQQIIKQSQEAAKLLTQMLAEAGAQSGLNLDFMRDKNVKIPTSTDQLLNYSDGQGQLEAIVQDLLLDTDYKYSFQKEGAKAFDDKFAINAEFGFIDVVNGEVIPKHYPPERVGWIATKRVETFEDSNVLATSVMDLVTPTELFNNHGIGLQTGTGIQGIIGYLDSITRYGRRKIGYDLNGSYWNERGIAAWGLGSDLNNLRIQGYTDTQINWMNSTFYPGVKGMGGLLMNILVHKCFFRMVRQKRFIVEKFENGTLTNATDRELKTFQTANFNRDLDLRFSEVIEKDKPDLSRKNIKTYSTTELHQFTRLGHDGFINMGLYEYQPDPDRSNKNYFGSPVVAQISYDKSMALIGHRDSIRVNILYNKLDEYMAQFGFSDILIIDDAQEGDPQEYVYNAKKSSVARYDSTQMQPTNQAQLKHMTTLKLSNHVEEIQVCFRLIVQITEMYQNKIGTSSQVQGIAQKYAGQGETQMNIANQQLLQVKTLREHSWFMNQMLQRCADILKHINAHDGKRVVMLSKGERKVLQMTVDLLLADFDIFLESGDELDATIKLLEQLISNIAQSGGAKDYPMIMEVAGNKNPEEVRQIVRRYAEEAKKAEQASSEQLAAQSQREAELKVQEMQLQVTLQELKNKGLMEVQQAKNEEKETAADTKGLQSDVNEQNDRERMLLQAELDGHNTPEKAAAAAPAQ